MVGSSIVCADTERRRQSQSRKKVTAPSSGTIRSCCSTCRMMDDFFLCTHCSACHAYGISPPVDLSLHSSDWGMVARGIWEAFAAYEQHHRAPQQLRDDLLETMLSGWVLPVLFELRACPQIPFTRCKFSRRLSSRFCSRTFVIIRVSL